MIKKRKRKAEICESAEESHACYGVKKREKEEISLSWKYVSIYIYDGCK